MDNIIIQMTVALLNSVADVVVAAYILTRTPYFKQTFDKKNDFKSSLFLMVFLGLFSIFGTISGFKIENAIANTRYIAPVIAGLIGGPVVGFGAGLIGAIHRFSLGGYTAFPSALSTVVAGIAAGLYFHYKIKKKDGYITVIEALVFAFIVQIYHMGQVLIIEGLSDFPKAFGLVKAVFFPMILANVTGTGVFAFIIYNLYQEKKMIEERNKLLEINTRIENELKIATDIQMSMVPTVFVTIPKRDEFSLHATMKPAKEVGGDFYDFFLVDNDKLFFVVGDVSDKGVPAALFMAVTKTFIKALGKTSMKPHELLNILNHHISEENKTFMFVTIFCGYLDLKTGELEFSNAGHNPPILLKNTGNAQIVEVPKGCILGVSFGGDCDFYSSKKIKLDYNDIIIVYTDGVTEAKNINKELFTESRLIQTVINLKQNEPENIVNGIVNAVRNFAGKEPQSDDITVLAIRYNKINGK